MTNITASNVRPSDCSDHTGALDLDVSIVLSDVTIDGEVTLLPAEDGSGYSSWGSPDHWVDGNILVALRGMDNERYSALLSALAAEAGAVADRYATDSPKARVHK